MGVLFSAIPFWMRLSRGFWCNYFSAIYYAHLELFMLNTFMAASIFTVVTMTIERYFTI